MQGLVRAIYPARCISCGDLTDDDFGLCGACWRDTGFIAAIEHLGAVALQSFDRDGSIRVWNRASEKLFGIPSGEAIGGDISTILSLEADASAFKRTLDEIHSSGKAPPPRERTIVSRDGTRRKTLSSMFPIKEGGEITEILCLDVDITGRS